MSALVVFDRVSWLCLPVDVRFTPSAIEVLHCREMMQWASNRHHACRSK
jgi:hypothetical protein